MGAIAAEGSSTSLFGWTPSRAASDEILSVVPVQPPPPLKRLAVLERAHSALLESLSRPAAAVVDGQLVSLNRLCAQLLSVAPDLVLGRPVEKLWPELSHVLARGERLEAHPVSIGGRDVAVTVATRATRSGQDAIIFFDASPRPATSRLESIPTSEVVGALGAMIGKSAGLLAVRRLATIAARSGSNVLIEGESGSGKEVLSQAIHASGPRRDGPFVAVHCGAIPRELLESELFGYEPGAFTGANKRGNPGKFELAQGGTLLLDDVVEMPLDMQVKLLRVVQERAVTRLGGTRPRRIDVRVVATTNVPLKKAVETGRFRADLYYRLNVLRIVLPPLRERREDIAVLAEHFLRKHSRDLGRPLATLGPRAIRALESYSWPGNIRELEHWIESEVHFAPAGATCLEELSPQFPPEAMGDTHRVRPLREVEREVYTAAMAAANGDVSRAARELGISRGKLYRKLALYGLAPRPTSGDERKQS
jgi:sigma-54 dependent transcriptional regulator, acetoin dehydrogenase operon transcriptional activator AcoR